MSILTKLLKIFQPETAHLIGKWAMRRRIGAPNQFIASRPPTVFGMPLQNRLGLAAGFDKNGELVDHAKYYGFGFIEVGSITHLGGKGNPKPRLFRLSDGKLLNRMGLNGDPASDVARRLKKCASRTYGTNIAKTHNPDILGDDAIRDIMATYQTLKEHDALGFYTVINVSCPNTREGKTFEDASAFHDLMCCLHHLRVKDHPLLIKLSPSIYHKPVAFADLLKCAEGWGIDGYVVANTIPILDPKYGKGGLSGGSVDNHLMIRMIKRNLPGRVVIACGGINTWADAAHYLRSGADLLQAYNGFVSGPYEGPNFAHSILKGLEEHNEIH